MPTIVHKDKTIHVAKKQHTSQCPKCHATLCTLSMNILGYVQKTTFCRSQQCVDEVLTFERHKGFLGGPN